MARGTGSDSCTLSAPRGGGAPVAQAVEPLGYFELCRLCEEIDIEVAPALVDGHYYHVAPLAERARIQEEGLLTAWESGRTNFPNYPRDPDCVYLWSSVVLAQVYADADYQKLGVGAHLILEADLISLDELCPDQEELARLLEEPSRFPGGRALRARILAEGHTLPDGAARLPRVIADTIDLIRALTPETRLLAANICALNGDALMWRGSIAPEHLAVCELNELESLYERFEEEDDESWRARLDDPDDEDEAAEERDAAFDAWMDGRELIERSALKKLMGDGPSELADNELARYYTMTPLL